HRSTPAPAADLGFRTLAHGGTARGACRGPGRTHRACLLARRTCPRLPAPPYLPAPRLPARRACVESFCAAFPQGRCGAGLPQRLNFSALTCTTPGRPPARPRRACLRRDDPLPPRPPAPRCLPPAALRSAPATPARAA